MGSPNFNNRNSLIKALSQEETFALWVSRKRKPFQQPRDGKMERSVIRNAAKDLVGLMGFVFGYGVEKSLQMSSRVEPGFTLAIANSSGSC